jgi:hypothetical protein
MTNEIKNFIALSVRGLSAATTSYAVSKIVTRATNNKVAGVASGFLAGMGADRVVAIGINKGEEVASRVSEIIASMKEQKSTPVEECDDDFDFDDGRDEYTTFEAYEDTAPETDNEPRSYEIDNEPRSYEIDNEPRSYEIDNEPFMYRHDDEESKENQTK